VSYKQVIIMRDDLNMRKGKMIAQGAHASMGALLSVAEYFDESVEIPLDENIKPWLKGLFTKVCVRISGQEELENLVRKAIEMKIPNALITDSGKTEFNGVPTVTCAAIGPATAELIDKITGHLKLL
jgi:PTH2 family peptidyl-tRNA hydrolase